MRITLSYKPGLNSSTTTITNSQNADEIFKSLFLEDTISLQEQFVLRYINRTNRVIGSYQLSKGGITGTIAFVSYLTVALKTLASGPILAHNHPSGNLKPSEADNQITSKIRQAAKLLIDHIIISSEGYYSFTDDGIL